MESVTITLTKSQVDEVLRILYNQPDSNKQIYEEIKAQLS